MTAWISVEELAGVAFAGSDVVMANEAHDGMRRCVRTRRVGVRLVRAAHALGVRDLAMEALPAPPPGDPVAVTELPPFGWGYLAQPDMRELVDTALGLGWWLWSYEARAPQELLDEPDRLLTVEYTNWREREQALNLARIDVPALLVWCGNGHAEPPVPRGLGAHGLSVRRGHRAAALRDRPDPHGELERRGAVPARRRARVAAA